MVLGFEGDLSWLGKDGSDSPFDPNTSSETKEQWLGAHNRQPWDIKTDIKACGIKIISV